MLPEEEEDLINEELVQQIPHVLIPLLEAIELSGLRRGLYRHMWLCP